MCAWIVQHVLPNKLGEVFGLTLAYFFSLAVFE